MSDKLLRLRKEKKYKTSTGVNLFLHCFVQCLVVHLFPEVLQHSFTTASEVGLQQDSIPLLVMHGLGDLTAQEPKEEMAYSLALHRENKTKERKHKD